MKKKNGFTLIELLAVIIILGILMIIAIPSVTRYISDSRKSAYVDTAKEIVGGARNLVNDGKLEMYDTDTTYYIESSCIKTENALKSPYGDFTKAYVVVTYDGKGYTYYWTSNDDAGQGIKEVIRVDKLDTNNVESDLKDSDISTLRGIDGRNKTVVVSKQNNCQKEGSNDATIQINGETGEEFKPVCRRATTLHTEECTRDDRGCHDKGYYVGGTKNTTTITYGNLGQKGTLNVGDAFDCDVNGDGEYNSTSERFYYVITDDNYAVLLFYGNVSNGSPNKIEKYKYDLVDENWHGPREGYKQLPSTSQWSNVRLRNQTRQIYAAESGWTTDTFNLLQTNGGTTEIFTYNDKSARLLTLEEVRTQCRDGKNKLQDQCEFLFENTQYNHKNEQLGSVPIRYWLETPYTDNMSLYWLSGDEYSTGAWIATAEYGIRPAIEVPLQDIYY